MSHQTLIVGVGSIGERHTRCFQNTGRTEVSICELNDELRDRVAKNYNIKRAYSSLDAALSEPHDSVLIAAPAHVHIPIAQQCADKGLHMLIEKPLALTLDGIDKLQQTVKEKQLAVGVAYVWRSNTIVQQVKAALDEGRFGKPLQITVIGGQHFPTFRPAYRDVYYNNRATGGGAIQDALTHLLNAGEWLVGPIDKLFADADHMQLEGVTVEDTAHVITRQGSVMGSYALNQYQSHDEITITIVCERGTVQIQTHESRWRYMVEPCTPWQEQPVPRAERDAMFIAQANQFLDCVEGKAEPVCSLAEGAHTLKVVIASLASSDAPKWSVIQ